MKDENIDDSTISENVPENIELKKKQNKWFLAMHKTKPVCGSGRTPDEAINHVQSLASTTNVQKGEMNKKYI